MLEAGEAEEGGVREVDVVVEVAVAAEGEVEVAAGEEVVVVRDEAVGPVAAEVGEGPYPGAGCLARDRPLAVGVTRPAGVKSGPTASVEVVQVDRDRQKVDGAAACDET